MSFKISLVKMAINWTPKMMVTWVANIILKGIAELNDYNFDLDERKVYVQTTLYGEAEPIEVWLEGFAILNNGKGKAKYFILETGRSNKPWLTTLLSKTAGRRWRIPVIPQFAAHMEFIAELLKAENNSEVKDG